MQTSHIQVPLAFGFINLAKRSSTGAAGVTKAGSGGFGAATGAAPGLGDSQAIHVILSPGFEIMQTSHVQDPPSLGFINLAKRSSTGAAGVTEAGSGGLEIPNESLLSASAGVSISFSVTMLFGSLEVSSSFFASVLPDPNTKPEG